MNDHTISLVRESFDLVTPIAPQAAALFYANLFEADPQLQPLFGALLKTLRQGLGAAWAPDVEEAWAEVYSVLADTMKEAAVPA